MAVGRNGVRGMEACDEEGRDVRTDECADMSGLVNAPKPRSKRCKKRARHRRWRFINCRVRCKAHKVHRREENTKQ